MVYLCNVHISVLEEKCSLCTDVVTAEYCTTQPNNFDLSMQTLFHSGIHFINTVCQLRDYKYTHSSLCKLC